MTYDLLLTYLTPIWDGNDQINKESSANVSLTPALSFTK